MYNNPVVVALTVKLHEEEDASSCPASSGLLLSPAGCRPDRDGPTSTALFLAARCRLGKVPAEERTACGAAAGVAGLVVVVVAVAAIIIAAPLLLLLTIYRRRRG
jgi:hypothetical protein